MQTVIVACPQERDRRELSHDERAVFVGPDLDLLTEIDAPALIGELAALRVDGIVGTKDRSALVASLVAARCGLLSPTPTALLGCQHKPTSRAIMLDAVPEATPRFTVGLPDFPPPWIAKPVVGRLSQEVRRIGHPAALAAFAAEGPYREAYAAISDLAGLPHDAVHGYIVEELVEGEEVTLEGYVHDGRVTVIGVTDSVKYAGTNSFERFEFPSALPADRLSELAGVAARLLPALGFDWGFFNVEYVIPPAGPAKVVEVNGRLASQFSPLVQAVHGRSTYEALVTLAAGEDPRWDAAPPNGVAISYAVRVFVDAFVEAVPEPQEGVELLVRPGLLLSEQGVNDTQSYRLAIFSEWAPTREEAVRRCHERVRSLEFELTPAAVPHPAF